ncbi:unnamed protein product, partial [Ranitomeya imitator]
MDPVKVQAIYDWTQPTSVKSLQKFLGFANFYRRFISNFSSVAKPLTDLTKKGADVVNCSSAAVEAFQELKRRFSSAPVLCQPDVSLPFQVEVDASEIVAGPVLSQRSSDGSVMKPCAFFSRKFSPAERNYDVGNRELLAMKWAFEEWLHWLEGAKHRVVVLTDHKNLTYLESAKRLNPRQARWSLFFRFDFVVSYLPGSKNVKADALSRSFVPDSPGVPEPAGILKEGTNGQTERTNQTLETYLRCFVSADQDDWVSFLPLAEFTLNNRASSATLVSPFFCNSGFHPRFSSGQVESSDCPGVDTVVDRLQQIWTHVVDNLTLSQEKAQRFANCRRCVGPRLRVGDLVWLSSRYVPMKVSSPKFKPRFIGPYRISEVLNPVSFRLTLPASFAIHNVFHRSLLRRYVAPVVPSVDPPAPVLVEGELEYVVENILDSRISRRKLQYLVKWKGYGQEDNSWVCASDVHAANLVRAFHLARPGRPGGSGEGSVTPPQGGGTVVNSVVKLPPVVMNGTSAGSVHGLPLVVLAILIVVLLVGSSGTQRERLRTVSRSEAEYDSDTAMDTQATSEETQRDDIDDKRDDMKTPVITSDDNVARISSAASFSRSVLSHDMESSAGLDDGRGAVSFSVLHQRSNQMAHSEYEKEEEDNPEEEPPKDQKEEDDEELVVLDPDHPLMTRFQTALKNYLAKQIQSLDIELREMSMSMKKNKSEREDLGVILYGIQQELARHQMGLEKQHDKHAQISTVRRQVEEELENIQNLYKKTHQNAGSERKKVSSMQTEVENLALRLFYMENMSSDVRSDISVMKRALQKTEEERMQAEMEKQKQDLFVDRLTRDVDRLREQIAVYESQVSAQREDTKAAREAVAEANMEIEAIGFEKKQLLQQWNSSLIGMTRRDEAYAAIQEAF